MMIIDVVVCGQNFALATWSKCIILYNAGKGERSALIECANTPSSPERCGIASVTSDRQVKQACSRIDLWQTLFAVAGHACHPISNGEFLMHPPIRKHCFQPVPAIVVPHLKSTAVLALLALLACLLACLLRWNGSFAGLMSNFSQQHYIFPTFNNSTLSFIVAYQQ
ncbi:hypothetical protein T4A_12944 [Trichinella pseudospiralis]|uniref:Uncharacterized protein n=1 Tax=Trichinella pseudospiralis TaxID=6337 RepID=A0A0V1EES8_TRIPS|nr:hypothetical protein T4A_12944 [Trichinella pseudospiralis]